MKKLFFIGFAALCVAFSFGLSSCSDDDDDEGNGGNNGNTEVSGENIPAGQWVEDGNTLTYKQSYSGAGISYTIVWTLTFENDKCVKSICKNTFPNPQFAEIAYNEMLEGGEYEGYSITKSGSTITIDFTNEHKEVSKEILKTLVAGMTGEM